MGGKRLAALAPFHSQAAAELIGPLDLRSGLGPSQPNCIALERSSTADTICALPGLHLAQQHVVEHAANDKNLLHNLDVSEANARFEAAPPLLQNTEDTFNVLPHALEVRRKVTLGTGSVGTLVRADKNGPA